MRRQGDSRCLLVGKPAEAWGEADGYLDYFRRVDGAPSSSRKAN